ncbi:putative pyridoxal phosphate-dependent aminotransferase EpsN [bioreactor metagenome]|uniref:Putative pyridoxal phosphate-dependent aminotransferase EpsN n=1 Tax=bioreactor metagenome TaxID=1076179 RepID=A0A645CAT2_9ZZZZ
MDCDDSLCMDPIKLEKFLREECFLSSETLIYKNNGRKISAIVIVDIFGNPADKEKIIQIARKYKLKIVEDSCEAMGSICEYGMYGGKHMGTLGDIGIYSFNGNKIITTGGGGMVVTDSEEIASVCRYLSTQAKDDQLYYVHKNVGYNYRMTNTQAALGLAQLELLEKFIEIKRDNYFRYKLRIENETRYRMIDFRENTRPNYWFYSLLLDNEQQRDDLINFFKENNIQTRPIWYLISELDPYKDCIAYKIEKAKFYWNRVLNLPCSTNLTQKEVDIVVDVLKRFK